MSYVRLQVDLAIKQPLPQSVANKVAEIRAGLQWLKGYAENINLGQSNEEVTTRAVYHICHHDTDEACGPEVEI